MADTVSQPRTVTIAKVVGEVSFAVSTIPLIKVQMHSKASTAKMSVSRPRQPTEGSPGQAHFPTSAAD